MPAPLAQAGSWVEVQAEPLVPDSIDQGEKLFIRPFMIAMADDHYALDGSRRAEEILGWRARHTLEILVGIVDATRRWRTMPWLVMLFGIMIVPLGVVSITFIIIQPIVLGTWCTLCLLGAASMLIQISYSLDELAATCQFLIRRKKTVPTSVLRTTSNSPPGPSGRTCGRAASTCPGTWCSPGRSAPR